MRRAGRYAAGALGAVIVGAVAALIGFRVAAARREVVERRVAAPPEGRFVRAGDVDLFIQEMGPKDGPIAVFTHGMGAWSGLWRPVLGPVAARGVRCVVVDMPPFGFSERPADATYSRKAQARRIWSLVDALGAQRVSLVGHSFGSGPIAEAALSHPERVVSLVLIAPAIALGAEAQSTPEWFKAMLALRPLRETLVAATLVNPLMTRRGLAGFMADPAAATDERIEILRRPLVVRGTTAALAAWMPRFLLDPDDGLSGDSRKYERLGMPTLLIWGDQDHTTPLPMGRLIQSFIPGSELVVLPGIGHMPQLESPAKVQELLAGRLAP